MITSADRNFLFTTNRHLFPRYYHHTINGCFAWLLVVRRSIDFAILIGCEFKLLVTSVYFINCLTFVVQISVQQKLYENSVFGINQRHIFDGEQDVLFFHFRSNETSEVSGRPVRLNNVTELHNSGFDHTKQTR